MTRIDRKSTLLGYHFYQLVDSRDGLPFYVGQTTLPEERLKAYLNWRSHYNNEALNERLKELEQAGLQPIMQELEYRECSLSEALEYETNWIHHLANQGIKLLNIYNNKGKLKRQTVHMPEELAIRLKVYAAQTQRDISGIITQLIEELLDRVELRPLGEMPEKE